MRNESIDGRSPITIEEIYNTVNRNYQWEQFKYQVPRQYHQGSPKYIPQSKSHPKLNYIDDVLKIKKCIPAPNAYTINPLDRPLSGKMDRNPRTTLADAIMSKKKSQQSPGPGAYFSRPKTADCRVNRNGPSYRQHYLNEVEYLSSECPGVGQYNVTTPQSCVAGGPKYAKLYTMKSQSKIGKIENKAQKKENQKQLLSQTLVAGTFEWLAAQKRPTSKNFFGKSKRFVVGSKFDKKPAPNFYKLNTKWSDSTNILKTSASFSNIKSVYYS